MNTEHTKLSQIKANETTISKYEKENKKLREKISANENAEESEEYKNFVDKFKPKKTTDDCYTPENIYETVVKWCEEEYNIDRNKIVRPFYPNGDYENFNYPKDCIVLDNPPFSILSKIVRFYHENNIQFFLFAPSLTIFNCNTGQGYTAICTGVSITYENGANVLTSFITNLNDDVAIRTAPELYDRLKKVNNENKKKQTKQLPKYKFPNNVVTSTRMCYLSQHGIDYSVKRSECCRVSRLDSQREVRKAIFGSGYLISNAQAQAQAQKEDAIYWELSEREKEFIKTLG